MPLFSFTILIVAMKRIIENFKKDKRTYIALSMPLIFVVFVIFQLEIFRDLNASHSEYLSNNPYSTTKSILKKQFVIGGWIPYWSADEAIPKLIKNISSFTDISPFIFELNQGAEIVSRSDINSLSWKQLFKIAKENRVLVIPTISSFSANGLHRIISDDFCRKEHVNNIIKLILSNKFDGIDIDYENKFTSDSLYFSKFIVELSNNLHKINKLLYCTIEPRYNTNLSRVEGSNFANDYRVLNKYCDGIKLMAYDLHNGVKFTNFSTSIGNDMAVSNSDDRWVETMLKYITKDLSVHKLILGVPTYGRKFKTLVRGNKQYFEHLCAINYPAAMNLAQKGKIRRSDGDELYIRYVDRLEKNIICVSDHVTIEEKIKLAAKFNLKGISLFKIDGEEDPAMWNVLSKY